MRDKTTPILNAISVYLGVLFLTYCTVYLCACPSAPLAAAIGAEVVFLVISVAIMRAKLFSFPERLLKFLPERIQRCVRTVNRYAQRTRLLVVSIVAVLATIDFAGLSLSVVKNYPSSIAVYTAVPTSYWLGLHPAFTLELLAGALVENNNFAAAEPLYKSILAIRLNLCGPQSDLAGAIYCDLGDLYVRMHKLNVAESWYRRSVALGARTGRAYGALATTLRQEGQLAESKDMYLRALDIRRRVYGVDSRQYSDTLRAYAKLQHHIDRSSN
jgi:tetratricopeptide (TPR) repeat protein